MSNSRRIIKNSVFEIATYGVRSLSLFLVPVLLARVSGPELLGEYVIVINLAIVFVFIADFGLPRLLTREISRVREDKEQIRRLVNASLGLVLIFSFISIVLMLAIGFWMGYSPIRVRALLLTGMAIALETLTLIVIATFRGSEEMELSWLVRMVAELVFLVMLLIILPIQVRIDWIMTGYLLSRLASLFVAARLYWPRFGKLWLLVDFNLWRSLVTMGVPFAINNAVTFVRGRLGVIILAFLSGSVMIAMLEVATGLTIRINVLGRSVNDSLFPFLSSQFVKDVRSLWKYTANGIRFLLIPGFLIASLLWVFGGELVLLLYGEEFVAAIPALKLLALLIPFRFITYSLGTALTASDRQGQRSVTVTVAAVTSVIFNFLLIPRFLLMGAVYAIIITEVILFGQTAWYLRAEMREIINWRYFIGPVIGSILILSASYLFTSMSTWVLLILSILIYLIVIVAMERSSIKPLRLMLSRRQL